MKERLTDEDKKNLEHTARWVVDELSAGKSKEKIVQGLVQQDWPLQTAIGFVDRTELVMANVRPVGKKK